MKLRIIKSQLIIIVALLTFIMTSGTISAQDEVLKTRLDLTCEQVGDQSLTLVGQGRYKDGRSYAPLTGQEFEFYTYINEEETTLGSATTDESGFARLEVSSMEGWDLDDDLYYNIGINYAGTDQYEDNFEEYSFKKGKVIVTTEEADEKSIEIQFFELSEGEEIPIEDIEVAVAVPMMFSDLIIGSDYTDEDGMVSFTFPDDLPGDENGNVVFVSKTIDADDYGVVLQRDEKSWGVPKAEVIEQSRSLWTPNAPLWMVATFTLLIAAVWGHFVYIIFQLINLKNEAKTNPA